MQNSINKLEILSILDEIKEEICQKFDLIFSDLSNLEVSTKKDNSIVTNIDLFISDLIKEKFIPKYQFLNFYSEEDQELFKYPMIILDPIDGTRELAQGINECVVSFGIYFDSKIEGKSNFSWLFNPFNGFEIFSEESMPTSKKIVNKQLLSYVSRTEYAKGLHNSTKTLLFLPKGSIANKLGLLAAGSGDFVVSKKPKNIWDIMAGTHICASRGINLYHNGIKLEKLGKTNLKNDLVWANEQVWEVIKDQL